MRTAGLVVSIVALLSVAACEDGPYDQPPPGDFACGSTFCDSLTKICLQSKAGATCEPVPEACDGTPSCSCAVSCTGGTCQSTDGSITVSCP